MWKRMLTTLLVVLTASACLAAAAAAGDEAAMARLPVKEVTVFKDGHAFVLREGRAETGPDGQVTLDDLPTPVIGTFWAYSADPAAKLAAVGSAQRIVSVKRTAMSVPELLRANVGKTVRLRDAFKNQDYTATVLAIPERSSDELARTAPPGAPAALPVRGDLVLLQLDEGVRAVPISQISEVVFMGEGGPATALAQDEFRNLMTYRLDWGRRKPPKDAAVGMVYLERGIRWIPSYKVDLDGKGRAKLKLQATLINELADLENVKVHLVIGVPTFAFAETPDPISLRQTVARLSSAFRSDNQTAYAFSNAIMSQAAMPAREMRPQPGAPAAMDLGPDVGEGGRNEDLFVFDLDGVTLAKGARLVVPVAEFELPYRDVFVIDLPFAPPPEVRRQLNNDQQSQLARLFYAPKAMHKIRLRNTSKTPLTTAPAVILCEGRLVAQGLMTYTAPGAASDLDLTAAVDIAVTLSDTETGRTPNAANWNDHTYSRTDLAGTIHLVNRRDVPVDIEVRRSVLGNVTASDHDGRVSHLGAGESGWFNPDAYPFWWNWYSWPYWWYHFNAIGRIEWDVTLKPGESADLGYTWHYFWDDGRPARRRSAGGRVRPGAALASCQGGPGARKWKRHETQAEDPRGRGRCGHPRGPGRCDGLRRVRRPRSGRRRGRPPSRRPGRVRPRPPGPRAAEARRPRRPPGDSPRAAHAAGHHPDGARRGARPRQGPAPGGRRLRRQAVQREGTPGPRGRRPSPVARAGRRPPDRPRARRRGRPGAAGGPIQGRRAHRTYRTRGRPPPVPRLQRRARHRPRRNPDARLADQPARHGDAHHRHARGAPPRKTP